MDRPDHPEDEKPGTTNTVPALIHDYRAQRDAWRQQARNLARMREEVLAAADREARDIVTAARADVRQILLKARRDLLVLAAQVRAAGRLGDADDTPDTVTYLPADDLGNARDALTTARHDVRRVLDESRPELEGLAAEGDALRAALRQQRPPAPAPVDVRRHISAPPVLDAPDDRLSEAPVDFEFTSIGADDSPDLILTDGRRPMRVFMATAAMIGAVALMGTGWWLFRSPATREHRRRRIQQIFIRIEGADRSTTHPRGEHCRSRCAPESAISTVDPARGPPTHVDPRHDRWSRHGRTHFQARRNATDPRHAQCQHPRG